MARTDKLKLMSLTDVILLWNYLDRHVVTNTVAVNDPVTFALMDQLLCDVHTEIMFRSTEALPPVV